MNLSNLTIEERERLAYAEGYTEAAALLGQLDDTERERDELTGQLDEIPSEAQRNQDAEDLENLKRFFYDCFERLAGVYPCPSWTSDYDKSVIFEAIEKGAAE